MTVACIHVRLSAGFFTLTGVNLSIWVFIWILLSAGLLGFSAWTFYVLYSQKKSWREFAKKNKLRFGLSKPISAPEITGVIDDYTIGIFTAEHASPDARGMRKLTAVEVALKSEMPIEGAVGSGGMVPLIQSLDFNEEFRPDHGAWDSSYIIRTRNRDVIEGYLSAERLNALTSVMKVKNLWLIFIFRKEGVLLRVDMPDPLVTSEKIEKIVKTLIKTAKVLELKEGEAKRLSAQRQKTKDEDRMVSVDDKTGEEDIDLELEAEKSKKETPSEEDDKTGG